MDKMVQEARHDDIEKNRFKYEFTKALQQLQIPKEDFSQAFTWWQTQVEEAEWARRLFSSVRGRKAALPHKKRFILAVVQDWRNNEARTGSTRSADSESSCTDGSGSSEEDEGLPKAKTDLTVYNGYITGI